MGEIINKISFNGTSYDISIPHATTTEVQEGTRYNLASVSSLPSIGQMIAVTFNTILYTPVVVFQAENEISFPMTIRYKDTNINPGEITLNSTYLFVVTRDANNNLFLNIIGGVDPFMGSHASTRTSYGVGTTNMYGHVKTITGDVSTRTSHTDGEAAAAYHSHSNYVTTSQLSGYVTTSQLSGYKRTFYLSSVTTIETHEVDVAGLRVNDISFQVNDELSYDLENGDVLIFPMTTTQSFRPGLGYHQLNYSPYSNGLTITTPSGERIFSFSDPYRTKFTAGVNEYNLICVVEKDTYLRVLNPVDYNQAWSAYTATTANYATTATQANKISTARCIDGLEFDGTSNVSHYGVCTVISTNSIKRVTITGLTAITGAIARVKFSYPHTVASTSLANRARLVLNNATYSTTTNVGVIRAYSTGVCLPSSQSWASGQIVEMIYDGTYWNIVSPYIKSNGSSSIITPAT